MFFTLFPYKIRLNPLLRFVLTLCASGLFLVGFSQKVSEKNGQTFAIKKIGSTYSQETVVKTFESANLQFHRFKTEQNVIVLDDGTEVVVFPAQKLQQLSLVTDISAFGVSYPEGYKKSTFSIKNNILLEARPNGGPRKSP